MYKSFFTPVCRFGKADFPLHFFKLPYITYVVVAASRSLQSNYYVAAKNLAEKITSYDFNESGPLDAL